MHHSSGMLPVMPVLDTSLQQRRRERGSDSGKPAGTCGHVAHVHAANARLTLQWRLPGSTWAFVLGASAAQTAASAAAAALPLLLLRLLPSLLTLKPATANPDRQAGCR